MHKTILDTKEILWQQPTSSVRLTRSDKYDKSTFFLTNPDPWDLRWVSGFEVHLYQGVHDSYPVALLRIFRAYIRVVSSLVSLASDIKQQEKAISAIADPGSKPQGSSNPFSWLTLVREGAQIVHMAGVYNISRYFLCAALNKPPLVAVPLPSPFNSSNLSPSFPLPSRALGEVPMFQDPLRQQLPFCYSTPNASWCNQTRSAPLNLTAPPASSLVASSLGTGTLTHSVQASQDLSARLQVAIKASAESLASFQ
ncbi:PREDICTED: endogenous retrovirus group FC1 Env polyprotein-like isoform X2 [Rhinopithecus bieti]|uniref:endogenous retrovirus group FC1 Env polyprotein-like isoform X2 n=1 Tax=Rhinopithecus bieti TaxID=61621 RepID=UPI00083C5CD4|nr:PREDICTED: endogenous retrovirus group FC1 Env polyprotein-like isoform X2 [Rhinopithecus bieti]